MITKSALPPPEFIQSALTELRTQKTLDELKHLGSPNRIRTWTDDASSMKVKNLVKIAEYAEQMDLEAIRYWKEILYCSDWPVVTMRQEWHEPHTEYVCQRSNGAIPGQLILCQGELCRYQPNSENEPHALSLQNGQYYKMDAIPDHIVIGKLTPIKSEE